MDLDTLLRSPWFYLSGGLLTWIYYGSLVLWGSLLLRKRVKYKKWKWLNSVTDSFFLIGFIVLSMDIFWMLFNVGRFLPFFSDATLTYINVTASPIVQALLILARNAVGMLLCYALVGNHIKSGIISFKNKTLVAYCFLFIFFVVVFAFAPDPTYTDWTYAIRQGCDTSRILYSLLVPYGLGKALSVLVIWSWWKR